LLVVDADDPRCTGESSCVDAGACDFAVLGLGLPAISADATTVIDLPYDALPYPEVNLRWRDVASQADLRVESIIDANAIAERVATDENACARARGQTRRRVARLDAALGKTAWRSMQPLAVEIVPGPDTAADPLPWPDPRPHAERPVQARLRHRQFVFRVPGIAVLQRDSWTHGPDIDLVSVVADPDTGTALARYALTSPVCSLAAVAFDSRILTITPAVRDAIDRRAAFATDA
jgi:hypothetical protein